MKKFKVNIDGKNYTNPKEVEKITGISRNTIMARWYRGIRKPEELLAQPAETERGGKRIPVPYNGKVYDTLGSLADSLGLPRELVYTRKKRGKTIETGLLAPKRVSKKEQANQEQESNLQPAVE